MQLKMQVKGNKHKYIIASFLGFNDILKMFVCREIIQMRIMHTGKYNKSHLACANRMQMHAHAHTLERFITYVCRSYFYDNAADIDNSE